MASIRARKSPISGAITYQVQVRRKGFPSVSKVFANRRDAQIWATATEAGAQTGATLLSKKVRGILLRDLLIRYRDEVTPVKLGRVSETYRINKMLGSSIAEYSIGNLESRHIAQFRDTRLKTGISNDSVIKELNLLSAVIQTARREWGVPIGSNPVALVRKPKPNPARETRVSPEGIQAILAASHSPELAGIVTLAVETGMRRGEIAALTWNRVDLVNRTVLLVHTKNGTPRRIPLSRAACDCLSRIERSGDRVFLLTSDGISSAFDRARNRSELTRGIRFHDLRHEATSRLFEKGLNVAEVASITGHKTFAMLQRYTHLRPELLLAKLDGI